MDRGHLGGSGDGRIDESEGKSGVVAGWRSRYVRYVLLYALLMVSISSVCSVNT